MYPYRLRGLIRIGFTVAVIAMAFPLTAASLVPNVSQTTVDANATYDVVNTQFVYTYSVISGSGNIGEITGIALDIKTDLNIHSANPLPNYPLANQLLLEIVRNDAIKVLPVEQERKQGWADVPLTAKGYAAWASGKHAIHPGETASGFKLSSPFPPGIRHMRIEPAIDGYGLRAHADDPDEVKKKADDFIESLDHYVNTLGPVGVNLGSYAHWNQLRDDLGRAIALGWVTDNTLGDILKGQLAAAREALDASDGTLGKTRLQTLVELASNAATTQIRTEARDLVVLNAQSLITNTADTPIPFEPKLTVVPVTDELSIGVRHTVTAKVVNVAHNDEPVPGVSLEFLVQDGPHAGLRKVVWTDSNGEASFSYIGEGLGIDRILVRHPEPQS